MKLQATNRLKQMTKIRPLDSAEVRHYRCNCSYRKGWRQKLDTKPSRNSELTCDIDVNVFNEQVENNTGDRFSNKQEVPNTGRIATRCYRLLS